jgi:hypothetical protein
MLPIIAIMESGRLVGRKVTKQYKGKLQTDIEDLELPNPIIRSHYGKGFLEQYVRDHLCLRTETGTTDVTDYGVKKGVENLPNSETIHVLLTRLVFDSGILRSLLPRVPLVNAPFAHLQF